MMGEKVFINSLPKSGTNLLAKLLDLTGYKQKYSFASGLFLRKDIRSQVRALLYLKNSGGIKIGIDSPVHVKENFVRNKLINLNNGEYLTGHLPYDSRFLKFLEEYNIKLIMMIRDPRAVIYSDYIYIKNSNWHPFHKKFRNLSEEQGINLLLNGTNDGKIKFLSMKEKLNNIKNYLSESSILQVKFEDIIGPKGGGDQNAMYNTIEKILKYLTIDLQYKEIVAKQLFGPGRHTFRKGHIEDWKHNLNGETINLMNNSLSKELSFLNYH